tara:strand:+ start:1541 stop:2149 length:609 start_codon:yes stop_codon:yes gene_type:complete
MDGAEVATKSKGGMAGRFKGRSYEVNADATYEEWVHVGNVLQETQRNVNWWIGDWLLHGESHFAEKYSQATHLTGKSDVTLRNCAWVASVFPPEDREWDLSYTHYLEVSGVRDVADRRWLLDKAVDGELTALQLRAFRAEEIRKEPVVLPPPQAPSVIPDELKGAIEAFSSHLGSCPITTPESAMVIQFPWGHLEMKFVRST